jgi:hypothetical protein
MLAGIVGRHPSNYQNQSQKEIFKKTEKKFVQSNNCIIFAVK